MRVCSLSYAACNAHAPYCIVICGTTGSTTFFSHDLINEKIFGKKKKTLLNIKRVLSFSLLVLSETFLILRRIQRDIIIGAQKSSCAVTVTLSDFKET